MTSRDRVLEFIRNYIAEHSYSPTVREIAGAVGLSTSATFGHVKRLKHEGVLAGDENKARTLRVL